MKANKLPALKYLDQCLLYDAATNTLWWKKRPRSHFKRANEHKTFAKKYAGKQAFCTLSQDGYLYGVIDKQIYLTHRVIWKMAKRKEPPAMIDHRDGKKINNALDNLREATSSQNCRNRRKTSAVSGYKGVYPSRHRWMAGIATGIDRLYLGTFDTAEEASAVRLVAEKHFFGKFAP